jgi:hypothetical protein
MNKKIYILIVLVLALNVSFGQNISPVGQDSLKYYIYQFGQLCDLSSVGRGVKQSSPRQPERSVAAELARLFKAFTIDTNRVEKDSLVIVPFLDPRIRLFDCYKIKNDSGAILRKAVDSCLNEKKSQEYFPKVSINQFIDTVYKFYSQTISDINQNDIQIIFDDIQHVHGKRYQVVAQAPLNEFRGSIDVNYSSEIGTKYEYKADIQKKDQLSFNLRFYLSYDKIRNTETRFQIDSVTMIKPTGISAPPLKFTKSRGYLEPYFNFGLSFINLNSEDTRFDNLSESNNFMLSGGVNGTFFFNDRRFSKWDLGFTTGVGYKSLRSTYSLDSYIDTLAISDDYTAQQLGGTYDLYVDATNLEQRNVIKVLEVPLQFTAYYNFNKKRNLGLYTRVGGVFNLVLSNDHTMEDGSVTYTGHIKKFINGEPTHYYFNADLPEYGFSTYEADVNESNELTLQNFFISGRLNVGVFGTNKIQSIGWHIGTFFDFDFTNMLAADHVPETSLTRGQGHMDSFYGITDKLYINNWGVEFGITIQLFKEKIKYRKTK